VEQLPRAPCGGHCCEASLDWAVLGRGHCQWKEGREWGELGGSWAGLGSTWERKTSVYNSCCMTMQGENSHQGVCGAEPGLMEGLEARRCSLRHNFPLCLDPSRSRAGISGTFDRLPDRLITALCYLNADVLLVEHTRLQ